MRDAKAFEEIFHEFYPALCNYATRLVNDADMAEEIVQELFVQLLEKKSLPEVEHIDRFLVRSTKFKCIDFLRKQASSAWVTLDTLPENAQPDSSEWESEKETEALFHYLVAKLPPKTREVFLLVRQSGLSYLETANQLNISVKTVEGQMGRAFEKMRVALKQLGYLSYLALTILS